MSETNQPRLISQVASSNCVIANPRRHHNKVPSIRDEPITSGSRHADSKAVRHVVRMVGSRYIRPCMLDLLSFYACSRPRTGCYPLNRRHLRSQSDQLEYICTYMDPGDKTLCVIFHLTIVLFSPIEGISWHIFPATSSRPRQLILNGDPVRDQSEF